MMKKRVSDLPLQRKIGLAIGATLVLVAVVFWVLLVLLQRMHYQNAVRQSERYLEMLVERESAPFANELFEKRIRALDLRTREILSLEGILSVTLYAADGLSLVHHDRAGHSVPEEKERRIPPPKAPKTLKGAWQGLPALIYEAPIFAVAEPFGSIRILYSLAEMERQRRLSYFAAGGLLAITFLIMFLVLNRVLSVTVSRPLRALKDAMERIEMEGPGEKISGGQRDEIGDLIGSFNRMSQQLQEMLGKVQREVAERTQAEGELRARTHQLEAVRGIVEEITRELDLDRLLELVLRRAVELTGAAGGVIALWDEAQGMLLPQVSLGDFYHPGLMAPFPKGEGITGYVAATRKGIIVEDYRQWPGARPIAVQTTPVTAALAEPLLYRGELVGVINLAQIEGHGSFEEHHLSLLRMLGDQAAIAIENARLYEEAQSDAIELHTRLQQIAAAQKDKEELTRQLYQAQKLEAIGTLAGGIAHDFNNILVPIIMGAELALMTIPVENQAHPMMQKVLTAGMRAKDLVQQILAFSRQSDLERRPMRLGSLLKETIKLARASLPATIEMRQSIAAEKDMVLANPTQVHQVMMNLFSNAGHAMREAGGVLEVSLENEIVGKGEELGVPLIRAGHFAKLMVSDTGHGMDRSTLEQIFNPFFTTKERGEGTGLGLSIVHGIIKSYEGAITVKSQPGQGTSFTIWIPLVEAEAKDQASESVPLPLGHERILFVDDEPFIVEISRQILDRLGYRVDTRTDPLEALEMFKRDPGLYDLVITDMTMPKMTGDRLAIELLRMRPEIPILLCTGFSERMTEAAALEMGIKGFIMKPIAVAEIARKVREALGDEKTGE
jgi:signal transduction histidine kinase/ActR/RegA family two-component response regulator/HAMP domain-containing protein